MSAQLESVSPAKVFARSTGGLIWRGPMQAAALNHLSGQAQVKVLLGPPGSGKSTILAHFQRQAKDAATLPISGPQQSALDTLTALLTAASLRPWNLSEVEQRNLLTVFLQERGAQGRRVILCIDNVAHFAPEAWSEIQRLRHMQYAGRPLVELAIVGTESDALRAPLEGLLQESPTSPIEAVHFLSAPMVEDIAGYIGWRLAQFGLRNMFTGEAFERIASLTEGRFTRVNLLCQVILWEQSPEQPRRIDAAMVDQAATVLKALKERRTRPDPLRIERVKRSGQPPTPPKPGRLVVSRNGKIVRRVDLNGRIVIGRSEDNDLLLQSQHISRHHAAIMPTPEGHYLIIDFNSTNGMLVNGKYVRRSLLRDGDVIQLCQFRLKVRLDETPAEAPAPLSSTSASQVDTDVLPVPEIETRPMRIIRT